jgi:DNA-binding MarR family transcriptional regulator
MEENRTDQIVAEFLEMVVLIMQSKRFIHHKIMESPEQSEIRVKLGEPQIRIMNMLLKLENVSMSKLGKLLMVSKPNVTTLVESLVDLELTERIPDKKDRRIIYIQLTIKGKEYILNYREKMKEVIKKVLENFSEKDLNKYVDALSKTKTYTAQMVTLFDKL